MKSPDVDVYDRHNRQGVHVVGAAEAIEALRTSLLRHLTDVITRRQAFPTDGIYKGLAIRNEMGGRIVRVDIGSLVGKLSRDEVNVDAKESREVIVQVQRNQTLTETPWLTTKITIPSEYAVLIPEDKIKVSLKIRDMEKRKSLIELGRKIATPGWGIIWRTTAADAPEEVLEQEISRLTEIQREVSRRAEEKTTPALLWGSQYYMNVEFPALSKAECDLVRAQVTQTIKGHHYYKACGRAVLASLEAAEKTLEDGTQSRDMEDLFQVPIELEYPLEGSFIGIEHVKPSGRVYHLGKARVEKLYDDTLIYSRVFKTEGFYDNLDTPKEPGDQAFTEAKISDWSYTTRYFSKEGTFKGAHVNFHTPLELYPRWVRYVDLEVDICVLPNNTVKILDEDELDKAVAKGLVSQRLATLVTDKVGTVLKNLQNASAAKNQNTPQ
jgi:Ribonuclease G/E